MYGSFVQELGHLYWEKEKYAEQYEVGNVKTVHLMSASIGHHWQQTI